jgi:FAD-linked sulfhydryl oxidase
MISRFTKLFLLVALGLVRFTFVSILTRLTLSLPKLLVATVTLFHRPVPSYLDLHTGALFGEGGVEKEFHALPVYGHDRPPSIPHATGSVIMSKLGNETAKYALVFFFDVPRGSNVSSYRAALGRATWKLL